MCGIWGFGGVPSAFEGFSRHFAAFWPDFAGFSRTWPDFVYFCWFGQARDPPVPRCRWRQTSPISSKRRGKARGPPFGRILRVFPSWTLFDHFLRPFLALSARNERFPRPFPCILRMSTAVWPHLSPGLAAAAEESPREMQASNVASCRRWLCCLLVVVVACLWSVCSYSEGGRGRGFLPYSLLLRLLLSLNKKRHSSRLRLYGAES